ncbi:MAG: nodulation protein NfeD [Pseudomonadota bacterium]|nr:nodulation protein NfeD [Pseudomonadota bacterium]
MRRLVLLGIFWLSSALGAPAPVVLVPLEGAIGPASVDFVRRALKRAANDKAQLVVLRMDTPGGLDTSMRQLIKDILASPVPVATFVAPSGSRAASAGTFILYASHFAAMAPGTNLGAASPVAIGAPSSAPQKDDKKDKSADAGDTMTRKATNDAVAYIRGLAEMRGRNADWAERAVREAVSLSAEQALKLKVIDYVAVDVPDLLKKLNKADATVTEVQVDWRTRTLGVITNPSIAYLLILVGVYALIFEFMNPGLILPGVVGAICILLALYSFHLLPVNYAGLALMLLGIAFMVAEAFLPAFGSLGIGGLIAFVIGSIILIEDTDLPGFEIPYGLIAGVGVASAALLFLVVGMTVRNRRRPVVSGREEMLGAAGEALEDFEREGWARVHGETWRVRAPAPVRRGERLRVKAMDGLVLTVEIDR